MDRNVDAPRLGEKQESEAVWLWYGEIAGFVAAAFLLLFFARDAAAGRWRLTLALLALGVLVGGWWCHRRRVTKYPGWSVLDDDEDVR